MDPLAKIAEIFAAHIEEVSATAVAVAEPLTEASEVMVHALLSDNKILCAGSGNHNILAQLFASHLVNQFSRERPGLPAYALSADSCLLNAISEHTQYADSMARQVSTIGGQGFILFLLAGATHGDSLTRALSAGPDRDMTVVLCHGGDQADAVSLLGMQDVEISLPVVEPARLIEAQMVLVNCLCELIDSFLFGGDP